MNIPLWSSTEKIVADCEAKYLGMWSNGLGSEME